MMNVEIIGHQDNLFGCDINLIYQLFEYLRKIQLGALLADPNSTESSV
jgi:hypothetical protein